MRDSVFLSTYQLRIKSRGAEEYNLLSQFNGADDLFPRLVEFLTELYETPAQIGNDEEQNTRLSFSLTEPPTVQADQRIIYGYFDVGLFGQDILVKNRHTKANVFVGDRDNDALYRNLFFYIKIPYASNRGYVVLQKKSRFGVKSGFYSLFKKWIIEHGYPNSLLVLNPALSGTLFNKMLEHGRLKKINFVVNHVPNNIDDYLQNNMQPMMSEGTITTTIQSTNGLSNSYLNFARIQYLRDDRRTLVEFNGEEREYDEIEFELELNGRRKTFYANKRHRTVPDLDVTNEVDRDNITGQPHLHSLIEKCREVIEDVFDIGPNV